MTPQGRRAGKRDTRAEILAAARLCFATWGYEQASLRQIARLAGVDPALVHHYFDGKPELFLAVIEMRRDPAAIFDEVQAAANKAQALARAFLRDWEPREGWSGPPPFATMLQAVCSSPETADALREFLTERVWTRARHDGEPPGPSLRQSMVTTQLWGMAVARYVLRIEPLASASLDEAVEWLTLLLHQVFEMPLDGSPDAACPAEPVSGRQPPAASGPAAPSGDAAPRPAAGPPATATAVPERSGTQT